MSTATGIEWTDATWNPVTGCDKVSPGCAHCYAETVALRFWPTQYVHTVERGFIAVKDYNADRMTGTLREFTDVMCHEDRLDQPLRWKKPRRVFVNSMSDLFHEDAPDEFIDRVFAVMHMARSHTFQVLTKRAARAHDYLGSPDLPSRIDAAVLALLNVPSSYGVGHGVPCLVQRERLEDWPLPNVWLGVSVENQRFADERIPLLLQTPAAVRFISAEPLLEGIDIAKHRPSALGLHWVIAGGESGRNARPSRPWWYRNLRGQCRDAGIAFFMKQLGSNVITRNDDGWEGDTPRSWPMDTEFEENIYGFREEYQGADVRVRLRHRKGGAPEEWPDDLRVREFPRIA